MLLVVHKVPILMVLVLGTSEELGVGIYLELYFRSFDFFSALVMGMDLV